MLGVTHPPGDRQGGCIEAWRGEEAGLATKGDGKEGTAGVNEGAQEQQCPDGCQHHPADKDFKIQ